MRRRLTEQFDLFNETSSLFAYTNRFKAEVSPFVSYAFAS